MEQKDRKQILQNVKLLMEPGVIDFAKIKPHLAEKKIFTNKMIEDINAEESNSKRVQKLLVDLCTRGPYAFRQFVGVLLETGQFGAAKILVPTIRIDQYNEVDSYRGSTLISGEATQLCEVKLATEWIEGDECYKMSSRPRGLCLIINNDDFGGIKEQRVGSERDMKMATKVFKALGYDVEPVKNVTATEMESVLVGFASKEKHRDLDSCVVIIMSHGDEGIVYGTDCDDVRLNTIFSLFNNKDCPNLIGKPKLFFIQACRGGEYDNGVKVPRCRIPNFRTVKTDGSFPQEFYKVPTWTDMLISYSSVKEYVSNRHELYGTWYIQTLLDVLMKKAWNTDLCTMLEEVGSCVAKISSGIGEKQSPEIVNRVFTKKLYFNPGLYK